MSKVYFSRVTTMGQLNRLFGSRGVVSFCPFEADEPTVNLMATVFEGRETALPSVTEAYEAYLEGLWSADIPNLPEAHGSPPPLCSS